MSARPRPRTDTERIEAALRVTAAASENRTHVAWATVVHRVSGKGLIGRAVTLCGVVVPHTRKSGDTIGWYDQFDETRPDFCSSCRKRTRDPLIETAAMAVEDIEDEHSYPPIPGVVTQTTLERLGVQLSAPSKRRPATTRIYDAPLDDAAIARCRAAGARKP